MNSLTLIFDGIAEKYRKNKVLFILMLVGILASSFMIIYFYGNYNAYLDSSVDGLSGRTYYAENALKLKYEQIEALDLSEYDIQSYSFLCGWTLNSNKNDDDLSMPYIENGGSREVLSYSTGGPVKYMNLSAYKDDIFEAVAYMGKVDLSGESDPYVAIVPCTSVTRGLRYDKSTASYGTVYIYGKPYRIIGVSTKLDTILIPYEAYVKEGYSIDTVSYVTNEVLPLSTSDKFAEAIWSAFGSYRTVEPYSHYKSVEEEYRVYVGLIFIAYTVSLISFAFFMNYFTELGMRTSSIYSLCGAKKLYLMANTLAQNLLLTVSGCIVALILNFVFGNLIDLLPSVRYSLRDAALILVSTVAATVILSIPSMLKVRRCEAKELCRAAM